jgi:DNA-binding NtrC family response regulator
MKGNGDRQRILVVDRNPELPTITSSMLAQLGYKPIAAHSPEQALEKLHDDPGIAVMITGIRFRQDIDGYQLAIAALKIRPALKIIYSSGGGQHNPVPGKLFLPKPYGMSELRRVLSLAFDEPPRDT